MLCPFGVEWSMGRRSNRFNSPELPITLSIYLWRLLRNIGACRSVPRIFHSERGMAMVYRDHGYHRKGFLACAR
jgi:hypothetical protein